MNRTQINGARLGNGSPNTRIAIAISSIAQCVSSILLAAMRVVEGVTTGVASALVSLSVKRPMTGTTSVSAATSVVLGAYCQKAFQALQTTGSAITSGPLIRRGAMQSTSIAAASTQVTLSAQIAMTGTTTARAVSSVILSPFSAEAPPERTTRVPYEKRETAVQ